MKPEQCRVARTMLGWSQTYLGEEAGVSLKTVQNFENGKHAANPATISMLKNSLERAGISFGQKGAVRRVEAQSKVAESVQHAETSLPQKPVIDEAILREQIKAEIKPQLEHEVRELTRLQLMDELRPLIRSEVMDEVRRELEQKLEETITAERVKLRSLLQDELRGEIEKELRSEVASIPSSNGNPLLEPKIREIIRQHIEVMVQDFTHQLIARANDKLGLLVPRNTLEHIAENLAMEAPSATRGNPTHQLGRNVREATEKILGLLAA